MELAKSVRIRSIANLSIPKHVLEWSWRFQEKSASRVKR
jgi:hypothetical protein